MTGFVPKAEREDINVTPVNPLREAALLVAGVVGGALLLFVCFALVIDVAAPWIPPSLERGVLGWWGRHTAASMDDDEKARAESVAPILELLLTHWPDPPYPIQVAVETSPEVNAYALPGGTILITTGLLDAVTDEMELAFVLGHELGHFANRDQMRGLGRGIAVGLLEMTLASVGIGKPALNFVNHLDQAASRHLDRRQETAADAFGVELLYACYGHADGAREFLRFLGEHENAHPTDGLAYLSTHPATGERLGTVRSLESAPAAGLEGPANRPSIDIDSE